jgi:putative phosphoribosyl transferase
MDDEQDEVDVAIRVGSVSLAGTLTVPEGAGGLVVFAHGSGSGRHSVRNVSVARALNKAGLGTLLFDLLTVEEEQDRANVFDVDLLAGRLTEATRWLHARLPDLPIGYFGASTGAAAALAAAAGVAEGADTDVAAVVSRGGRPDLAMSRLASVRAPTLLIVGSHDPVVLELNMSARDELQCPSELAIVDGATHLFAEPGALEQVASLAAEWFLRYLTDPAGRPRRAP